MTAQPSVNTSDRRDCALYRFWVRHPATGRRVLGYIGETARMPFQRLMEHVYDKPWADTIIGWEVDGTTYAGKAAVVAAEEAAIRAEKPLYNHEFNLDNPNRVEKWRAVKQRQAREPGWQPPAPVRVPRQRSRRSSTGDGPAPGRVVWPRARIVAAVWAGVWLLTACVVGWKAASGPVATWVDGLAYGAGFASVMTGLLLPNPRPRRRR